MVKELLDILVKQKQNTVTLTCTRGYFIYLTFISPQYKHTETETNCANHKLGSTQSAEIGLGKLSELFATLKFIVAISSIHTVVICVATGSNKK